MSEMTSERTLRGILTNAARNIKCRITPQAQISCLIGKSPVTIPAYEGSYEIQPKQNEQIMPTKGRMMQKDMKIQEIPYEEVSNNTGGKTVTIGGY